MKRFLSAFAVVCLLAVGAHAQSQSILHNVGGIYYSPAYNYPAAKIATAPGVSGAGSVTLVQGWVTLADGYTLAPWTTSTPITFNPGGANSETLTPSAVSGCGVGTAQNSCTITVTFANVHGAGESIVSGSAGIQEAIGDASNNGGGMVYWVIDPGVVVLATGSTSTALGTVTIPVHSTIMGAVGRVTTTITGSCTGWGVGHTTGTEFLANNTNLTAGSTSDTTATIVSNPAVGFNVATIAPKVLCAGGNATLGAVHVRIWGYKMAVPAS